MSKCNIDNAMQYKIRTLINEITKSASDYTRSTTNTSGVNALLTTNLVGVALAAGIGCRALPNTTMNFKMGYEVVGFVHNEGVRTLLSSIGELVYIDSPMVLKWSNDILANRYDQFICPSACLTAMNIKEYLEKYVPNSHNFTAMWVERIVALVNEYMVLFYEG